MTGPCSMNTSFYLAQFVHREAPVYLAGTASGRREDRRQCVYAQSRHYTSQCNYQIECSSLLSYSLGLFFLGEFFTCFKMG